jgi:uncharacterized protein YukE
MNKSEFRDLVAKSSNQERCENLTLDFYYATQPGYERKTGLTTIYEYVKSEKNGWNRIKVDLPNQLENSKNHFNNLLVEIEKFAEQHLDRSDHDFQRQWNPVASVANRNQELYSYKFSEVNFLIDINEKYPNAVSGAHSFFMTRGNQKMNLSNVSHDSFIGYLLAYEYELQDETEIQQRRNNEKISIGKIRTDFEKYLEEAGNHVQEITKDTLDNFHEHLQNVDDLEKKKEELFDQWFGNSQNEYQDFYSKMVSEADEMKELFRDGLRFAGPVKHWRRRALKMKKDGAFWIKWLTGSSALVALSLFLLLIFIPEGMTRSLFAGDPVAIKWAILYVTFISFMVYAVRTFAKLTFSSYHLARDAEEREQLTHVYLALKKEGSVEEKDRVLILQSLFSRAETGLLKDDSSPTLPGNNILNKINGSS